MIVDRVIKIVINLIFQLAEAFDNSINLNATLNHRQKQPQEVFCKKKCSSKFRKIHRKTSGPDSLF